LYTDSDWKNVPNDIPTIITIANQFGSVTPNKNISMKKARNALEIGERICELTLSTIFPINGKHTIIPTNVTTPEVDIHFLLSASFSKYPESIKPVSHRTV
jgi:hypothetical protein